MAIADFLFMSSMLYGYQWLLRNLCLYFYKVTLIHSHVAYKGIRIKRCRLASPDCTHQATCAKFKAKIHTNTCTTYIKYVDDMHFASEFFRL